jgi:hypothetical protein
VRFTPGTADRARQFANRLWCTLGIAIPSSFRQINHFDFGILALPETGPCLELIAGGSGGQMESRQLKCPRCGRTGDDLLLIGKDAGSGILKAVVEPVSTVYAYKCKCGLAFTFTVRNRPIDPSPQQPT